MRRFKDLTTMEKAAFDDFDQIVEKFLPIELMYEGIVYPDEPQYEEIIAEPEHCEKGTTFYRLTAAVGYQPFKTQLFFKAGDAVDASDVLKKLGSLGITFYANQYEWDKDLPKPAELGITYETFYSAEVIKRREEVEKRNGAILAANSDKRKAYDAAMNAVEEVKDAMYEAWREAVRTVNRMTRIIDTFNKYVELAGGDRQVAMRFLLSARDFTNTEVAEALNEHGISIDESLLAPAAPSEAAEA